MILLIEGLPGTGKSTTAKAIADAWGFYCIDEDQCLSEHIKALLREGHVLTDDERIEVAEEMIERVRAGHLRHEHIVATSVILKKAHRCKYYEDLTPLCIHLEAPLEVLKTRLEQRGFHFFDRHTIDRLWELYESFGDDEGFSIDATQSTQVLVEQIRRIYHVARSQGNRP